MKMTESKFFETYFNVLIKTEESVFETLNDLYKLRNIESEPLSFIFKNNGWKWKPLREDSIEIYDCNGICKVMKMPFDIFKIFSSLYENFDHYIKKANGFPVNGWILLFFENGLYVFIDSEYNYRTIINSGFKFEMFSRAYSDWSVFDSFQNNRTLVSKTESFLRGLYPYNMIVTTQDELGQTNLSEVAIVHTLEETRKKDILVVIKEKQRGNTL
jgi:hypothetical protein